MNDSTRVSGAPSERIHIRSLDHICDTFETAWLDGSRPAVEKFLGDTPEPERTELLSELIRVDVHYRRKAGETPMPSDYADRFPSFPHTYLAEAIGVANSQIGATLNGYQLREELGHGGMGRVYRASHPRLDQEVALKVLQPGMDSKPILARFEAERQTLARMDHPHIARVFDGGATDDCRPFFVMELVRGVPVTRYCEERHLALRQRLELFIDICLGVQHAHQKGIIHRDLKPSNILVAEYDGKPTAKIIDFGIARATERRATLQTEAGMLVGTPEYMSPEQADPQSQDIDTRTDVYSLGVILYELLVGETPFARRPADVQVFELLRMIREVDPTPPSKSLHSPPRQQGITAKELRDELDWITLKCLEKDRSRRYQTAEALADDVRRFLDDQPVLAGPPSRTYQLRKFLRRNRGKVIAATLLLGTLVAGISGVTWAMFQAQAAERRASTERDIAQAVRDFFQGDLLAQTDAFRQQRDGFEPNPNLTLREALDRAAERIPGKFDRHPLVEAGIRQTIGDAYSDIGVNASAEPHLARAVEIYRENLGDDDSRSLGALRSLAQLRNRQGRNEEATDLYQQVLESYQRTLGAENVLTLGAMNDVANVQLERPDLATAEAILANARAIEERCLDADHQTARITRSLIGKLHLWRGDWEKAEPLKRETYEYHRTVFGEEHLETLRAATEWGAALVHLRRFPEAEPILIAAFAGLLQAAGPRHPATLRARLERASLVLKKEDYSQAEPLLRELLQETREVLGPEHRLRLYAKGELGVLHQRLNRNEDAATLFREVLDVQTRQLGDSHYSTLLTLNNYAGICIVLRRFDEAESLLIRTIEGKRKLLGATNFHTLQTQINLANLYAIRGNMIQAAKSMEETLTICREHLPGDSEETTTAVRGLGLFVEKLGDLPRAEALFRELVERTRFSKSFGRGPYNNSLHMMGQVLVKQDKFVEAEKVLREALNGLTPTQARVWLAPRLQSLLGMSLLGQGKYAEAEPLLLTGFEGLEKHRAQLVFGMSSYLPDTHARIIELYEKWNKPELALEWRNKSFGAP